MTYPVDEVIRSLNNGGLIVNVNAKSQSRPRLQAVPFWIVERSREIAKREKLEQTSGGGLGSLLVYFSSLQSCCAVNAP